MKEGRSKVVFKRLIRHKGFLKIHLAELQMSCKFLSSIWPSGSFCLTTRRTLILIFFVALNSHLCSQLKTTFCCFKTLFNWVSIWWGAWNGDSYQVDVQQILRLRVAICNERFLLQTLLRISHDEQRSLGIWLACISGFGKIPLTP